MRRLFVLLGVVGMALAAQGAAAQPEGPRCRALTILRHHGVIYFHHKLKSPRPKTGSRQGIGMERACDDTPDPADPPPWYPTAVYSLDGISPKMALAPAGRRQVVFYDIYRCTPRFGEARFLRCLRRK